MCRSFESSLEPSLRRVTGPHANLRVAVRVYDVEGGAIFAKNSTFVFFDGFVWTPRLRSPSPIMAPGHMSCFHGAALPRLVGLGSGRGGGGYEFPNHVACSLHFPNHVIWENAF